jgi:rubrerythrin
MSVRGLLPTVRGRGTETIYECRRCGTTLDADRTVCPYCGPTSVVEIQLLE